MASLDLTYVLPLKTPEPASAEFAAYLRWLVGHAEVIVADGSAPAVFAAHAAAWPAAVHHVPPDPQYRFANGKVDGVLTGVALAGSQCVVIADDDVRYDAVSLARMADLLSEYDLVRPQNYFDPLPWHAVEDTGRTLLNRSVSADFPGTVGVRREVLERTGGYDGDVMFENLELIRTVEAAGGRTVAPLDLFVRRLPPTAGHFWRQRVRQAFDELARPYRMAAELAVAPLAAAAVARRRWAALAAGVAGIIATAEVGRRRGGGTAVFPARTAIAAPLWVTERAVCSWLALAQRLLRGGVAYGGGIVGVAAHSTRQLRRRLGSGTGNHVH